MRWGLLCTLLVTAACQKNVTPPIEPGPTDWPDATPLTQAEIDHLSVPDAVFGVLPYGRATPVRRIPTSGDVQGFAFSVAPDGLGLTIHGTRRQLGSLTPAPLIYGVVGPSDDVHDGVAFLFHNRTELAALQLATDARQSDRVMEVNKFLLRWHPDTRVSLVMATPTDAWVEIDWLPPGDADAFLAELTSFLPEGTDTESVKTDLTRGDPIAIPL